MVTLVATTDEIIQWMTPGRYWDFHDVRFDALSAALAQVVLAKGLRPPFISPVVPRRSVRHLCGLVTTVLLMLTFCLMNTPQRVVWYASRIPFLEFLLRNDSIMSEFGHRHVDRDIGTFYSRFSTEDLLYIDAVRGEEVGQRIAEEFAARSNITDLCKLHTAGTNPFLHEFSAHLVRRDHYSAASWKYLAGSSVFKYHQTIAYRENQLLEKYFGRSLTNSARVAPPGIVEGWKDQIVSRKPFRSPVSGHLITNLRAREVRYLFLACLVFVATVYFVLGREPRAAAKT
jgi:hypothetical protein